MSEIITPLIYQFGTGGILGFVVGYAVKKVTKILAVIAGLLALALLYLGFQGIINVNYDKLSQMVEGFTGNLGQASSFLTPLIANLPFAGSFAVGAAIGLKVG